MIVDILDANNNKIGELELPDGTSQDVINEKLALLGFVKPAVQPIDIVSIAISNAADFGRSIIIKYAASNVLQGITQAGKTQALADYLANLSYYLKSGSLYAAIAEMNRLIADTSDEKSSLAPYLTNDLLYTYLNYIQSYLVIPLTPNPGS